jgi:phage-related protein
MESSKKDLLRLPASVIDTFGFALYQAQVGRRHAQTRTLRGFGDGSVIEVIESLQRSTYRAVYTVRFSDAVYVLHVFQKKSKSGVVTPASDMDLVEKRLKQAATISQKLNT